MKTQVIVFTLLLTGSLAWGAQRLALNPGDVYSYSFTNMNFTGMGTSYGSFYGAISITFAGFSAGSQLKYEIFEDTNQINLLKNGVIGSGAYFSTSIANAWQDLNGSVRLTMQAGACTISDFSCIACLPSSDPNKMDSYGNGAPLTSPSPRLVAARLTDTMQFSWWTNGATGFVLESTNVLTTGTWPAVVLAPAVISNRYVVTTNMIGQNYFRLRK